MYYYRGKKQTESIYTFALQEQEGCTLLPEEEQLEAAISLGLEQWTCLLPARPDLLLDLLLPRPRLLLPAWPCQGRPTPEDKLQMSLDIKHCIPSPIHVTHMTT